MGKWWMRAVLALCFAAMSYGFASWAIDSGAWLAYGLAFFFLVWAIMQLKHGLHYLFSS